jgi:methyltransferase family protein
LTHPEETAARRHLEGYAVEVGCGDNPTPGVQVTVDHTPRGQLGTAGSQEGRTSDAGVCARMDALPFRSGAFDTLLARHTLEHHPDTLGVLEEWRRVATRLVVICPDQERYPGNTLHLDPTHRVCFTPDQLQALVRRLWTRVWTTRCVPAWSFLLVAEG